MNVMNGDGWEKLCPFLRLPIPKAAFPHANKTGLLPRFRRLRKRIVAVFRR